jgi:hypothetical protein
MIEITLYDTMTTLEHTLHRMGGRGVQIDEIERASNELLDSSNEFVDRFDPWYVRVWKNMFCCPRWWCEWKKEEETDGMMPWVEV